MNQGMAFSNHLVDISGSEPLLRKLAGIFLHGDDKFAARVIWLALMARYSRQDELEWLERRGGTDCQTALAIALDPECSFRALGRSLAQAPQAKASDAEAGPVSISGHSVGVMITDSISRLPDKVELCLVLGSGAEAPRIAASADLFSLDFVRRLRGHFLLMLEHCLAAPDESIFGFPLLTKQERRNELVNWNMVDHFDCAGRTLHGLFMEQAAKFPDRIALSCNGAELSYIELDERSNQLAHAIRALYKIIANQEMKADELIGLSTDRSIDMVVGILGIQKAGGAYVPLDPRYPEDRLRLMAEDARCKIILTTQKHIENLLFMVEGDYGLISLDTGRGHLAQFPRTRPEPISSDNNLAYVIYTSGSTGRPKGVMLEHGCAVRLFDSTEGLFSFSENDVWTCFHSYAFDFSVWEIWGALLHGARLVIVPYDVSREPDRFHELVRREKVTVLSQTPSSFYQFAEADGGAARHCSTLRYVVFGGEALSIPRLEPWWENHPWDQPLLINMYGITETTVHSTFHEVSPDDLKRKSSLSPIGERLCDLSFFVLDDLLQPVPPGVPGELYIGGAGVARGYFRRDELNRERFIASPFAAEIGERAHPRLYKSGDLVVRNPDGSLDYLGRSDFQVKIRGFRVETGEIESVLQSSPAVKQAVVLPHGRGEAKKLVAYYVSSGGNPVPVRELWEHLAKTLPDYMIPARFIHVERFGLTATGKTDRKALPDPDLVHEDHAQGEMVAPRTAMERRLARIWSGLLGDIPVGVTDNFFMLGGDSLLGARMVMLCKKAFARDVSIKHVFEHPVLADLARRIEAIPARGGEAASEAMSAEPETERDIPASPAQRSMYYLYHAQEPRTYNVPFLVRFEGALDHAALREALNRLLARHESLRTVFYMEGGKLFQRILEPRAYEPALEHVPSGELSRRCAQWAGRAFDLERYPLFDIRHIDGESGDSALYVNIHHIVFDGNSYDVFLRDLGRAYAAVLAGKPALPVPHWQYRHYARAMLRSEQSGRSEGLLKELAERFSEADPEIHWPHCVIEQEAPAENLVRRRLDPATVEALSSYAMERNATLFALLLALYQSAIHALSGQGDLTVGVPVSSRPLYPQAEDLIGFLVVTAPFTTRFSAELTLDALLAGLQRHSLAMLDSQEIPLDSLARVMERQRNQSGKPMFQALFAMENSMNLSGAWQGQHYELEQLFNGSHKFDALLFCFNRQEQGLEVILEYNPDKPGRYTAEILVDTFLRLAESLAARPDAGVGEPLRHWLARHAAGSEALKAANRTKADYPGASLAELVSRAARQHPDQPALIWQGEAFSYAELEDTSDRLAAAIVARAGRPGRPADCIGLYLRRGPEMIFAMLAALKAGYAYLPLDPDLPEQRISRIYSHARPALVLCKRHETGSCLPKRAMASVEDLLEQAADFRAEAVDQKSPAYILYTSGTTGMPKGVVVSHRSAVNRVCWMQRQYGLKPGERYLLKTPSHFDVSVGEIFWPLSVGATLVIAPPDCHRDPACILDMLESRQIENVHFVPAMLSVFLDYLESGEAPGLSCLKRIFCSGEGLPQALVNRCLKMLDVEVHNLYGPTETGESSAQICPARDSGPDIVPIGLPISNTRYHLLNPVGLPMADGLCGELYIAGDCLADGYLRDPEKTNERFVTLPWIEEPRMYRTGDLVAWSADKALEYHGRNDHQIKIRGFRVELGEIESALLRIEGVRLAAARFFARSPLGPCIVADYTGDDAAPEPEQALASLKNVLPSYMVPAKITRRGRLPVTASGKVDREALPEPQFTLATEAEPGAEPRSMSRDMRELAELWAGLLGRPAQSFAPQSDFFLMGGHSLLLMQMIVELRKTKGIEIRLPVFLQEPTLDHLARLCLGKGDQGDRSIEQAMADARTAIERPPGCAPTAAADKPGIVLTGAAGFIGSHILRDLLCGHDKRVIALVRAKDGLSAAEVLDKALGLRRIHLGDKARQSLQVFDLDLTLPGLGLGAEAVERISAEAGHILHCGAMVNHLYGYTQHRPANILGTMELLRLAVTEGMGRFDFISTTAAQSPDGAPDPRWSGYVLSKWTGEGLCRGVRGLGIDSRILRVGYVTGHSVSGLVDQGRNHLSLLIRSFVETGVAPDWQRRLEITPVDHLAHEIAELIGDPKAANGEWNLSGTLQFSWPEFVQLIRGNGYPVRIISHREWFEDYLQKAAPGTALHLLKGLYAEQTPVFGPPPENNYLGTCRPPTMPDDLDRAELFSRYLGYFRETGFIPGHE